MSTSAPPRPGLDLRLSSAVAVVTGASSGIGLQIARQLAKEGARVALVAQRADVLEAEVALLREAGCTVPAELSMDQAPSRFIETVAEEWGAVDCLVNDAAIVQHMPLEHWSSDAFDEHVAVNVRAPFFLVQQALPFRTRSSWGSVANISSSSGALRLRGQSVYGMTKSSFDYLTGSLAGEIADSGARINDVAPGPIDTPIHATWADDLDEAYRWLADQVPLGRIGSPEDMANMVLFLLSPPSSFVTGAVIPVDGGQVIRP